jgi:glucose-1-phosphate thymidylyltransferase
MTTAVSKQLLPVYDKPMIYYPMTTLIEGGIMEVLIISQKENLDWYRKLFGDGAELGIHVYYATQAEPKGLAEAILIAEQHCRNRVATLPDLYDRICLILGDNVFHGGRTAEVLQEAVEREDTAAIAQIFVYQVDSPHRYGVAEIPDGQTAWPCKVPKIIEKPTTPPSRWAVPGLYIYQAESALDYTEALEPSARGELEITDLNNKYAERSGLYAWDMGHGAAWLDSGTPESLLEAAEYVRAIQTRQGVAVGSPHIAALRRSFVTADQLARTASKFSGTTYGTYLAKAINTRQ